MERASRAYLEAGLTTVADAQVTARELAAYREARSRGVLGVRTVCMPLSHQLDAFGSVGLVGPFGDEQLAVGHLKVYADGSLTGGTAAFSDELAVRGQDGSFFHEPGGARRADRARVDRGMAGGRARAGGSRDLPRAGRVRAGTASVEPSVTRVRASNIADIPTPKGIERMRRLGVTAVNQPSYLYDYGDEYAEMLGEAVHDLQPWRDELDAGVRVVISSDSDVSSYRPLTTIANAMLRRTRDGTVLGPRHRLDLEEALFAHTIDAAYAVGWEHRIGSLEPMKAADLTIVAGDIRSTAPGEIPELPVLETIVGGEVRFGGS